MRGTVFAKVFDIALTLIACALVLLALGWFVHTFNVFELPPFMERFFGSDDNNAVNNDAFENNLLELIESSVDPNKDYEYVALSPEKAAQLLSSLEPVSDFFWEVETTFTRGSVSRTQLHKIYKQGERVRIDTVEEGLDLTTVIAKGKTVTVNNETGEVASFGGDTDFSYGNIINIAALDFADDSATTVNDIAIVEQDEKKYIYAEIPKKGINGVDKYFVSLDYGLVLTASSSVNGVDYFYQNTLSFDDSSVISDNAFDITDLKTAEPLTLQ